MRITTTTNWIELNWIVCGCGVRRWSLIVLIFVKKSNGILILIEDTFILRLVGKSEYVVPIFFTSSFFFFFFSQIHLSKWRIVCSSSERIYKLNGSFFLSLRILVSFSLTKADPSRAKQTEPWNMDSNVTIHLNAN